MLKPSQEPQIFNDAIQGSPEQGGASFEVGNNAALDGVTDAIFKVQEAIVHDKSVTAKDILDLKASLGVLTVDIEGMKVPIGEIKNNEELKRNIEIWERIKGDDYKNIATLTLLSNKAAEHISKRGGAAFLDGLIFLSDKAAEHLSKLKGSLSLGGLTSLSDKAAEHLSNHKDHIWLSGLISLSDIAAEHLSRHKGSLSLIGLTTLSDTALQFLTQYKGNLHVSTKLQKQIDQYKEKK